MVVENKFLKRFFFLLVVLIVLCIFLLPRWFKFSKFVNHVTYVMSSSFQERAYYFFSNFSNFVNRYIFLISIVEENKILRKELNLKSTVFSENIDIKLTNLRLRDLLGLKCEISLKTVPAEVIARDTSALRSTISINKGRKDGIKEKFPVISGTGIVGMVVEVVDTYSKVMLITDIKSSIDACIIKNNVRGVIEGCGNDICIFRYVTGEKKIDIGDNIVSSGLDGIFPKGINIGIVSVIGNFNLLGEVIVLSSIKTDKINEVFVISEVNY